MENVVKIWLALLQEQDKGYSDLLLKFSEPVV